RVFAKYLAAEIKKNTVMMESVYGIHTVKSLALEPQRREAWDRSVADAAGWKQRLGLVNNWPQTIVTPLEVFMQRGVLMVGAYIALIDGNASVGSLMAFMMLSGRVASPLVGLARLIEDVEEVRASVGMAASVLNNRPETTTPGAGLRPR